jgi:hypothetical protein
MLPPADARARLSSRQAALVAALTANAGAPPGFEATRLRAASESLASKRLRGVSRSWPRLVEDLGDRYPRIFADYAASAILPGDGTPLEDGRAFSRWLAFRGELSDAGRLEAMAFDLRFTEGERLQPRRGLSCRIVVLRRAKRVVLALRWPGLGERWWRIPIP